MKLDDLNLKKRLINEAIYRARWCAQAAEEWTRTHGIKELGSDTRIESEHSIHAHKAWGFTETERVVYFRKDLD